MWGVLEECARANPDARICPLTHASVDRAHQAESVGSNSLVVFLLLFVALQIYERKSSGEIASLRDLKKDPLQLQEAEFLPKI